MTNGSGAVSHGRAAFCLDTRKVARDSPNELNIRLRPTCPLPLASPFGKRDEVELSSSRALSTAVQDTTMIFAGCSCSTPSGSR